jgi:hypothetical protein
VEVGLRGIEVRYPYNKTRSHRGCSTAQLRALIDWYNRLADELGLLDTGGSDYHAAGKETVMGEQGMTYEAYRLFKRACGKLEQNDSLA